MGITASIRKMFQKDTKLIVIGIDNSGKTVLMSQFARKIADQRTIPTIGFNMETFVYKNLSITAWDIGGQDRIRSMWHYYYKNASAIIFVVDSADGERVGEAFDTLHQVLRDDDLAGIPLLIYANKSDLAHRLSAQDLINHPLARIDEIRNRNWYIIESCAITGDGVFEGLDWLATKLNSVTSRTK